MEALREYHIEAMLRACANTTIGRRDAAIIAIGFAAALRRSELCKLTVEDVEFLESEEECHRPNVSDHSPLEDRPVRKGAQGGDIGR